jgi:histidinol-phosphate aminotransferase
VTESVGNFLLVHFPGGTGQSAADAENFLLSRRIILRRLDSYGIPNGLRLTVGLEAENRAVVEALRDFVGEAGING